MPETRTATARAILVVRDAAQDWHPVSVSVGPDHVPLMLVAESAFEPDRRENRYRIVYFLNGRTTTVDVQPLGFPIWRAASAGRDAWLVVGGPPDDPDGGATVLDAKGYRLRSFFPGSHPNDVESTGDGRVWIGFYDEGVEEERIGRSGLVCFDLLGQTRFRFNDLASQHDLPRIFDCYALNVASDTETWCYYLDGSFTLCRIRGLEIDAGWRDVPVRGASAFAVDGERALFAGSYETTQALFLWTLADNRVEELSLRDENGEPFSFGGLWRFGRGACLYFASEETLWSVDLADLQQGG